MELNLEDKIEPVKLFSVSSTPEGYDETLSPIIFIPGFISTNRTFNGVKYKISKRTKRKIYAIDLRNHGKSEYTEQFTLPHFLADLEVFMETENIPKAVFAGHSMGGRLALAMALKHPDKVEKIIVEDISVVSTKSTIDEFMKSLMYVRFLHHKLSELPSDISEIEAQKRLTPHVKKFWPKGVKNFTDAKTPFRIPFYKDPSGKFAWEFNMEAILATGNHFDRFDIDLSTNPVYTGDTLLLAGENSFTAVQNDLDNFYKYFPNLECREIPNGFHTYHVEFPELYSNLVSKFVGEEKI